MADTVIGRALIAINPDFSGFLSDSTKEATKAGTAAGNAFVDAFEKAVKDMDLIDPKKVSEAAKAASSGMAKGLGEIKKDAAATGDSVQKSLTDAAQKTADAMTKVARDKPLDGVAKEAARVGDEVTRTFAGTAKKIDASLSQSDAKGRFKPLETAADSSTNAVGGRFDKLRAWIKGDFEKAEKDAKKSFGTMESDSKRSGSNIGKYLLAGISIATVIGGFRALSGVLKDSVEAQRDSATVNRVTAQILKSTGASAWTTADSISEMSAKLQVQTGVSDEMIQSGQNVLLTFTGVRNEVGKGNDVFDRATKAALDMATVMGGSGLAGGIDNAKGASLALGKALNDPIKGMTKLQRSGVVFTDAQKKQVKALQESGDLLGAQAIILNEVEKEFGGAAAAAADPMKVLSAVGDNLRESLGRGLVGALQPLASSFTALVPVIEPLVTVLGVALGGALSAVAPLLDAIVPLLTILVQSLSPVLDAFGSVFGEIGPIITDTLTELGPEIKLFGEAIGGVVKSLAPVFDLLLRVLAPVLGAVMSALTPVLNVIAAVVPDLVEAFMPLIDVIGPALRDLGDLFAEVFAGQIATFAPVIIDLVGGLADVFAPLIPILVNVAQVIGNALVSAYEALAPVIMTVVDALSGVLAEVLPVIAEAFLNMLDALSPLIPILGDAFMSIIEALLPILPTLGDALVMVVDAFTTPEFLAAIVSLVESFVQLLPVVTPLVPLLVQMLPPIIGLVPPLASLVAKLLQFKPLVVGVIAALAAWKAISLVSAGASKAMSAAVVVQETVMKALSSGTKIMTGVQAAFNAVMAMNPVVLVVAAVAALGVALFVAYKKFKPFHELVDNVWHSLHDALEPVLEAVAGWLGDKLPGFISEVTKVFKKFLAPVLDIKDAFAALLKGDFGEFFSKMGDAVLDALGALTAIPEMILGFLGDIGPTLVGWFVSGMEALGGAAADAVGAAGGFLSSLPGLLIGALGDMGSALSGWLTDAFTWLAGNALNWLAKFWVFWLTLPIRLIAGLINFGATLFGWMKDAWQFVTDKGPEAVAAVIGFFKSIPGRLLDGVKAGIALGQRLFEWAKDAAGAIARRGVEILASAVTFFKSIPGRIVDGLAAGVSLGARIFEWAKNGLGVIKRRAPELIADMKTFFTGLPGKIGGWISSGISAVSGGVGSIAGKIWHQIIKFVNQKLIDPLKAFKVSVLGHDIKPFGSIPRIAYAEGAVVTTPTTALIGEAGPEVVIPLTDPARAAELVKQSGLADVLAKAGGSLATPLGSGAIPMGPMPVAVDAKDPSADQAALWFKSFAPLAIEALQTFGQDVWKAVGPSFIYLQEQMLSTFQVVQDFVIAMPLATWTGMQANLNTFSTGLRSAFTSLSAQVRSTFSEMIAGLTRDASTGGSSIVNALTSALSAGTTAVQAIVHGYAVKLAASLNPLLTAMGEKKITIQESRRGNINDPRIVGDGSNEVHVFGERGTRGEAYIPFDPALRERSRSIATETVRRLGGEVSFFRRGGVTGDTQGLNPEFMNRLSMWSNALGRVYNVVSGFRRHDEQVALYQKFLAGTGNLAAVPGTSMHEFGLAADGPHWKNLDPGAFNLEFNIPSEDWHIQPVGARGMKGMMPDGGWMGAMPIPDVPSAGNKGVISQVAAQMMGAAHDKAMAYAGGLSGTGSPVLGKMPVSLQRILATIRLMESGNNYSARNPSSSASGAYQFINSTWGGFGGYPSAYLAPPSVQDAKAAQNVNSILGRYNQNLEAVPAAWYSGSYRGPGKLDYNPGGPGNPLSVQGYVDRWLAKYASVPGFENGAIFDGGPTIGMVGEAGTEVLMPMSRPERALQLAVDSGLMKMLDEARGYVAAGATVGASADSDGGILGGGPGNTYNIYGLGWDQVLAEIEARDEAATRVRE